MQTEIESNDLLTSFDSEFFVSEPNSSFFDSNNEFFVADGGEEGEIKIKITDTGKITMQKLYDDYITAGMSDYFKIIYPDKYKNFAPTQLAFKYTSIINEGYVDNPNDLLIQFFNPKSSIFRSYFKYSTSIPFSTISPTWNGKEQANIWNNFKTVTLPYDVRIYDGKQFYGINKNFNIPYDSIRIKVYDVNFETDFNGLTDVAKEIFDIINFYAWKTKPDFVTRLRDIGSFVAEYAPGDYYSIRDIARGIQTRTLPYLALSVLNNKEKPYYALKIAFLKKSKDTLTDKQKEELFAKFYDKKPFESIELERLNKKIDYYVYNMLNSIPTPDIQTLIKSIVDAKEFEKVCPHKKDLIESFVKYGYNDHRGVHEEFDAILEKYQLHGLGHNGRGKIYCSKCMEIMHEFLEETILTQSFIDQSVYTRDTEISELLNVIIKDMDYITKRYIQQRAYNSNFHVNASRFIESLVEEEKILLDKNKLINEDVYENRLRIFISAYCCAFLAKIIDKAYNDKPTKPNIYWKFQLSEADQAKLLNTKTRTLLITNIGLNILHLMRKGVYGKKSGEFNEIMVQTFYQNAYIKISQKIEIAESGRHNADELMQIDISKIYSKELKSTDRTDRYIFAKADVIIKMLYAIYPKHKELAIPYNDIEIENVVSEYTRMFGDVEEKTEKSTKKSKKKVLNPRLAKWNQVKKIDDEYQRMKSLGDWFLKMLADEKVQTVAIKFLRAYMFSLEKNITTIDHPEYKNYLEMVGETSGEREFKCHSFFNSTCAKSNFIPVLPDIHVSLIYGKDGHIHDFSLQKGRTVIDEKTGKIVKFICAKCDRELGLDVGNAERNIEKALVEVNKRKSFFDIVTQICPIDFKVHVFDFNTGVCKKCKYNSISDEGKNEYYEQYGGIVKMNNVQYFYKDQKTNLIEIGEEKIDLNTELTKVLKYSSLSINYLNNVGLINYHDINNIDSGLENLFNKFGADDPSFDLGVNRVQSYIKHVIALYYGLKQSRGILLGVQSEIIRSLIHKYENISYDTLPVIPLFIITDRGKFKTKKDHYIYYLGYLYKLLNSLVGSDKVLNEFVSLVLRDIHDADSKNSYIDILKIQSELKSNRMRLFAERYLNQDEDGFDLDGEYDEEEIKKKSGDGEGDDDDDDEEIIDSFTMQDLDEDKQLGDEDDEINLRREDR
jgi:hypothetical protein